MPPRSSIRRFAGIVIALALSLPSLAHPQEDATAQARSFYQQGRAALRANRPEAARLAFERAYELRPSPQIGFALGMAEFDMGLYVEAAMHMAPYMHQFPDATREEKKAFAEAEQRVAHLTIESNVDRAQIYIDGVDIGSTPFVFQPIYVLAGRRVIRATCEGFLPVTQTFDVVAGKKTDVHFILEPDGSRSDAGAPSAKALGATAPIVPLTSDAGPLYRKPPSQEGNRFRLDTRTAVVGSGAALAVAASIVAIVETTRAASATSDANALKSPYACAYGATTDCARLQELERDHQSAIDIGRAALIGAGVLGGATLAAWFLWPHSTSGVRVMPQVHSSSAGIVVSGDL
jgi:hypothetical protein